MDQQKYEKKLKTVKWCYIFLFVVGLVLLFTELSLGILQWVDIDDNTIILLVLLLGTIIGCSKQKLYGYICGILSAFLMIISFELVYSITGFVFFAEFFSLIKYNMKD